MIHRTPFCFSAIHKRGLLPLFALMTFSATHMAFADDGGGGADLRRLRQEIEKLQSDQSAQRHRIDQNEQLIQELEGQLRQVETQNQKLNSAAQQTGIQ